MSDNANSTTAGTFGIEGNVNRLHAVRCKTNDPHFHVPGVNPLRA